MKKNEQDIPYIDPPKILTPEQIISGPRLNPLERITLYSEDEFERFIHEWAFYYLKTKRKEYVKTARWGGAGDLGRDVVGYIVYPPEDNDLDIFQCKHYDKPLTPGEMWVEIGKVIYYTLEKFYKIPRFYYFVSPHDVGPKLGNLLENPKSLKEALILNWDKYCSKDITKKKIIHLSAVRDHVENFSFYKFKYKPIIEILEEHKETVCYPARFGGGLKPYPEEMKPPHVLDPEEARYIQQLNEAYLDDAIKRDSQPNHNMYKGHFQHSREKYYSSETLKQFTRENFPDLLNFKIVQDDVFDTVEHTVKKDYFSGLSRLDETMDRATTTTIVNNPLKDFLRPRCLQGICHQLANENRLIWVKKND